MAIELVSELFVLRNLEALSECDFLTWFRLLVDVCVGGGGEGEGEGGFIHNNISVLAIHLANTDF